jgi:pyruvate,water dikinase
MNNSFTLPFSEISRHDVHLAGGKGASLGEMTGVGIPVPPGFVILASAFDRFLHETDLYQDIQSQFDKINYQDTNSVEGASVVIRDLIHDAKFPQDLTHQILAAYKKLKAKYVAVRSSATAEDSSQASWAGELETYLNTTAKTLIGNVKKCWSSLFTPRAIFYRREKKLHKSKVSVAVVVQKMVQSEVAGIAFTVHPVTGDKNQMIIEAGWGLGEAVVSGQITPDSYVVDKRDFSLIDINVLAQEKMLVKTAGETSTSRLRAGNHWVLVKKSLLERQKLSGQQIRELAKICLVIEKHYGFPCDIEWAYEKKKFYITQSRPITTL